MCIRDSPYTQGLTDSFPKFETGARKPLVSIGGSLPDLSALPAGCVFAPRCKYACDVCRAKKPQLREINGRRVACHLAGGETT